MYKRLHDFLEANNFFYEYLQLSSCLEKVGNPLNFGADHCCHGNEICPRHGDLDAYRLVFCIFVHILPQFHGLPSFFIRLEGRGVPEAASGYADGSQPFASCAQQ